MSDGNGSSVKLLYWIMGALLMGLLALVSWNASVAQQETATLRQQLYTHELQALGGYQRISVLEAKVVFLEQACSCAATVLFGPREPGGGP